MKVVTRQFRDKSIAPTIMSYPPAARSFPAFPKPLARPTSDAEKSKPTTVLSQAAAVKSAQHCSMKTYGKSKKPKESKLHLEYSDPTASLDRHSSKFDESSCLSVGGSSLDDAIANLPIAEEFDGSQFSAPIDLSVTENASQSPKMECP